MSINCYIHMYYTLSVVENFRTAKHISVNPTETAGTTHGLVLDL